MERNKLRNQWFSLDNFQEKEEFDRFFESFQAPLVEEIDGDLENIKVTFLYRNDKPLDHVVIGQYGLASFSPNENVMTYDERLDIWHKTYLFPKDARLIYAFSPNHALIEMEDTYLGAENFPDYDFIVEHYEKDPKNPNECVLPGKYCCGLKDKTFSVFEAEDAMQFEWKKKDADILHGKIVRKTLMSKAMGEEVIFDIYLPPSFNKDSFYRLLVCFDGEAYQELIDTPNILNHLIDEGSIDETIAIFIHNKAPNPITRLDLLNSNENFTRFVAEELINFLQGEFHLSQDPKHHVITGSSAGGLASLFAALCYPHVFGKVLAQSGAFWFEKESKANWIFLEVEKYKSLELDVYLDIGKFEVAKTFNKGLRYIDSVRKMRDLLQKKGCNVSYYEYSGGHDYISWDKTFVYGLKKLLSKEG